MVLSVKKDNRTVALQRDELYKLGNWTTYLFGAEFWFGRRFSDAYKRIVGTRPYGLFYFDGTELHEFFSQRTVAELKKQIKKETEVRFFSRMRKEFYLNRAKLFELKAQFDSLKKEERLGFLIKKVFPLYATNAVYDWIVFLYEELHHNHIYNKYQKQRPKKVAEEFPILVVPSIATDNLKEQLAVLKEALRIKQQKTKDLVSAAKKLEKDFSWLPIFMMGEPYTASHYQRVLSDITKQQSLGEIKEEVERLGNYPKETKREKTALLREISIPADLKAKINTLSICAEIRTFSDEAASVVGAMVRDIFKPLADLNNVKYKDLHFLNSRELISAHRKGKVDKATIKKRKNFFVAFSNKFYGLDIYEGEEAKATVKPLLRKAEHITDTSELKGLTAYSGKVKGRVHIILGEKLSEAFQEGEVLVAPNTVVQYVPMMKKAAAIVTDHGGLTSHAAIVSRELKTPCIVGVKIATKVLKDGDLVEVDAEQGIVRLLNK